MFGLYLILAAVQFLTIAITGVMWMIHVLRPGSILAPHFREIRIVHLGALFIAPTLLTLAIVFRMVDAPIWIQLLYPAGLGAVVFLAGIAYYFPRPSGSDPFYYWTHGWAAVLSVFGLILLSLALVGTAGALTYWGIK